MAFIPPRSPNQIALPSRYEITSILGTGAYGTVCEAYDHQTACNVAIKCMKHIFDDLTCCKRLLRELAIMNRLDHDCIMSIAEIYIPPDRFDNFNEFCIIMEICDSDIKKMIYSDIRLEMIQIKVLMYDVLRGLKYLHSAGISHRDLKAANILVNQDCSVKICDFNLSCCMEKATEALVVEDEAPNVPRNLARTRTSHVVSRYYRAPEVILLQPDYTEAIDNWSAACVFAEVAQMLHNGPRFEDRSPLFPGATSFPLSPHPNLQRPTRGRHQDQLDVIFDILGTPSEEEIAQLQREDARCYLRRFHQRPGMGLQRRLPFLEPDALELIQQMLRFNPRERLTAAQALEHPFFYEVREPESETSALARVRLDFEEEAQPGQTLSMGQLRELILEEMRRCQGRARI